MNFKKIFSVKNIALCFTAAGVVGGSVASIVTTTFNNKDVHPFVLVFKNGNDASTNSNYRLLGRHQVGYPNSNKNDKFGSPAFSPWEIELGLGLDNSNPVVQAEQLNWLYYLLFFGKIKNDDNFKASKDDIQQNVKNSTFDGIRIDCGDAVDSDVIGQTSQLLNELYGRQLNDANANDHLSYYEGYGPGDVPNEKKYFHNNSLAYDDSYFQNMTSSLMYYDKAPSLNGAKALISNKWQNDETENEISPNLTYSQNHDNFNDKIWNIARELDNSFVYNGFNEYKSKLVKQASDDYYKSLSSKDKTLKAVDKTYKGKDKRQISPKNQVTLYADMLTNKDTVPIVFYGDIFESQEKYMSTPSAIAQPIMDILSARSKYVSGGQQRKIVNSGKIITNVRFGKDYFEGKTTENDSAFSDSRNSGIVTVYSNDKNINEKQLKIYVGKNHANQNYINLLDTTNDGMGITRGSATNDSNTIMGVKNKYDSLKSNSDQALKVDDKGYLTISNIKGVDTPFVDGYLSMWVPEGDSSDNNVYVTQNETAKRNTFKTTGMSLNSNDALDSHVLFQDFSTIMPNQGLTNISSGGGGNDQDNDQYAILAKNAQDIADAGITDIWMAPPYISPDQTKQGALLDWVARYGYGYMMSDRYNLGDGDTPSRYGTADQLIKATDALHNTQSKIAGRSIKLMVDFVPHQIIRGDDEKNLEKVTFDQYNSKSFNKGLHPGPTNQTKYLQTKTSDENYQYKFGGKYLETLYTLAPDIFDKKWLGSDETLPYKGESVKIKNWSAKYEVSYPLEFETNWTSKDTPSSNPESVDGYYLSKKQQGII